MDSEVRKNISVISIREMHVVSQLTYLEHVLLGGQGEAGSVDCDGDIWHVGDLCAVDFVLHANSQANIR